jgi:hypothetical protein
MTNENSQDFLGQAKEMEEIKQYQKETEEIFDYWYLETYLASGGRPIANRKNRWKKLGDIFSECKERMEEEIVSDKRKTEKEYSKSFEYWYMNVYLESGHSPVKGEPNEDDELGQAYDEWLEVHHFMDDMSDEERQDCGDVSENMYLSRDD